MYVSQAQRCGCLSQGWKDWGQNFGEPLAVPQVDTCLVHPWPTENTFGCTFYPGQKHLIVLI